MLALSRSGWYYRPAGESEENLRLMRLMGLAAIYQKPNTSRSHPQHRVYPYLLRGLQIDRLGQPQGVILAFIQYSGG